MDDTAHIQSIITSSIRTKEKILADAEFVSLLRVAGEVIASAFKNDRRLYCCGNGGSAADAQHIAAEFTGRFYIDRKPLPAEALHVNTSFLTAVANDYSYDQIYERAIQAHGREGDILIGISTSGNSKNVVLAQKEAQRRGMIVISLTGQSGGMMKESSNFLFNVPSTDTPRIQESHIMLGHILCQLVEESLFGGSDRKD